MATVGLVQMRSSTHVEENLAFVEQRLVEAHEQGLDLILLPENFAAMSKPNNQHCIAEHYGHGPIQEHLSSLAQRFSLWIIAGTMPIKTAGTKVRASSIVYDHEGKQVARYDKIHLFDVQVSEQEEYQESLLIEPGIRVVVVDTPVGAIGLSVCYDLRFAELYQQLVLQGAELFVVPAAFTALTGEAHWEVLLRARAIENLSFVLAANQYGHHDNGRDTYGHSMAVDPWGKVIDQKKTGIGLLTIPIDVPPIHQLRKQFPCLEHHVLNQPKIKAFK